jgi:hypothetical protein
MAVNVAAILLVTVSVKVVALGSFDGLLLTEPEEVTTIPKSLVQQAFRSSVPRKDCGSLAISENEKSGFQATLVENRINSERNCYVSFHVSLPCLVILAG